MSFRHLGTRYRLGAGPGAADGGPVQVFASAPKRPTVYVTKPMHTSGREESIGMSPQQAREIGELLIDAAAWCEQRCGDSE